MKKILVIPGTSIKNIQKRQTQIAMALSVYYDVYILRWNEGFNDSLRERIKNTFKDFFRKSKVYEENGIKYAEFPFLHRPLFKIKWFNPRYLKRFIKKYDMDVVLNGVHYFFWTPAKSKVDYKHIFDLNDLPYVDNGKKIEKFRKKFTGHEIAKADIITACSRGLVEYIKKKYGRKPVFVPNGTYLDRLNNVKESEIENLKRKYNLKKYGSSDIIFTGGIPGNEISPYYKVLDAGVLPSRKSLFQDLAFHTKLIDYTAARKTVLAAPLEEIKKLNFPNIITSKLEVKEWVAKMKNIEKIIWKEEWNNLATGYDWSDIGKKFRDLIEK